MKKWKFLFWFVLCFVILDALTLPFSDNPEISDFLALLLSTLVLVPLYGFSHSLAIGSKLIAKGIFIFSSLEIVGGFYIFLDGLVNQFHSLSLILGTMYLGYLLVRLWPQFMYAFKSNELWAKNI